MILSVYLKINTANPTWRRWGTTPVQTVFSLRKTKGTKVSIGKHNKQYWLCIPNFPPDRKMQKQDYLDVNMITAVILMNSNNQISFYIGAYMYNSGVIQILHISFCSPCIIRAKGFTHLLVMLQNYIFSQKQAQYNIKWSNLKNSKKKKKFSQFFSSLPENEAHQFLNYRYQLQEVKWILLCAKPHILFIISQDIILVLVLIHEASLIYSISSLQPSSCPFKANLQTLQE